MMKMTENKRFVCYFDNILKKWCVQDTDSLDMHYVADEPMGEEFAHLLNLYQQTLDKVEKENWKLKQYVQSSKKFTKKVEDFFQKCGIDTVNFRVLENLIDADNLIYEKYLKLEEENEQLTLISNHRGEMVSFATFLIQDMGSEEMLKMWNDFTEVMYQKWKKKRGI